MTTTVLFDMDGVLTDSEPVINAAAIAGLREFGVRARPEDFLPFVGTGEDSYIGGVARLHGRDYDPIMKKRVYEIYLEILPGRLRPFPGVLDLLRQLRRRCIPFALASSADRIKVQANLKAIGLSAYWFSAVISGDDVAQKKPSPDIYLEAARQTGAAPEHCCVVEDAISGIQAAKAAGMRCVAVAQSFEADALAAAGPDRVRPRIADVTLQDLGLS